MGKVRKYTGDVDFWRDAELGLEVRFSFFREHLFPVHTHAEWSVALIDLGVAVFELAGEEFRAEAGEIAVVGPETPHACNPPSGDWGYRLFHVNAAWLRELAGGEPRFAHPVIRDSELHESLSRLQELIAEGADLLERQTAMTEGFSMLLERHAVCDCATGAGDLGVGAASEPRSVARVRAVLDARACEKVNLDELASAAGLSPSHLLRLFRTTTGLTPHAYQTQKRIQRARDLLAAGRAIAEVAADTGFTDQAVFTRAFRRYTGATPGQYRDALKA